jgi:hypothetical protein
MILKPDNFKHYIDFFNEVDRESIRNAIPNERSWEWMLESVPWFECPDKDLEQIYYFRWWVFRKHLKETPSGFVITEFLPEVKHARKYNTIACAAALHIEEGRWLRNRRYVTDYIRFWFSNEGEPRQYSTWLTHATWEFCKTTGDHNLAVSLLPEMVKNYMAWEASNLHVSGLFWSRDVRDGGEYSISGNGLRPTLNSYMYGDAITISKIASLCGQENLSKEFSARAMRLRRLLHDRLWDAEANFFKAMPLGSKELPVRDWSFRGVDPNHNVREIYGYLPWKFGMAEPGYESAWRQLKDHEGFAAPYGPTTAEQRHPRFMKYRVKRCQWDGPSWPFTTSLTLAALSRVLHEYEQSEMTNQDFFDLLKIYTRSQHRILPYGEEIPWIDENLHPYSGIWLARAIALEGMCPVVQDMNHAVVRGKDYNHSSYCDLIINELIGFQPQTDDTVVVNPLLPNNLWDWFCLDSISYHGRRITVLYDRTGQRYGYGPGFKIFADGREIAHSDRLSVQEAKGL